MPKREDLATDDLLVVLAFAASDSQLKKSSPSKRKSFAFHADKPTCVSSNP
jgi:hypothetical protein